MFKNKKSTFTASLSTFSAGYTSAILSDPILRISSCLFHARKEFWEIQPYGEHRTPPPSTTSKISNPLNFLLLQTRPNCIGSYLLTKWPNRRLHSGPPCLLHSIIWRLSRRETTSHLCFHSEACLYPQPSLRMPDWALLQKKMSPNLTLMMR